MELNIREDKKLVNIWLTKLEKADSVLQNRLNELYKIQELLADYLVAVFESGSGDLYENTRDLLLLNQRRTAEKSVQQEKKQRMTEMKH